MARLNRTDTSGSMTLYETLAHRIIDDIKARRLPVGTRLLSLRSVSKQNEVSMTTATKAYDYLQQTGWIYAQPQSGFFVAGQIEKMSFPVLRVKSTQQRDPKHFAPENDYDPSSERFSPLGTSMIAPELQPSIALKRTIKRVTHRAGKNLFRYPNPRGENGLRQALAEHFRLKGVSFTVDDVVITSGCIDAVRLAVESLSQIGDTIAISSPCFSGLLDLLAGLSRRVIEIPIQNNGLDMDYLESIMQQGLVKAVLISTSNINPIGITLSIEQKRMLAELVARHRIPLIEDDVYSELSFQNQSVLPVKYWDKEGYVLWCGSFSKTLAAGLRIGWCLPGRYFEHYLKQHTLTSFGVNGLMQISTAEFINTGEYRAHVNKVRLSLDNQIHAYRRFLIDHLPNDSIISAPDGGLVLWAQIPNLNAVRLEQEAFKNGIDIRSGARFSTHHFYRDCFRINCGWPLDDTDDKTGTHAQLSELCQLANKLVTEN